MKIDFNEWLSKFKSSISDYTYYVDFEKIYRNVDKLKVELNILNSLIGSKDIENDFQTILIKYPETLECIPLLLAVRSREIFIKDEMNEYLFDFRKMVYSVPEYIDFMRKSGLFDLLQNHIINNYDSINYFKSLGYDKVLINNDLTISEIKDIIKNTSSHIFMYYISKNNLMYSKRHLISSFNEYKKDNLEMIGTINEKVSNHELIIKEENCGTCIFNSRIFSANKYIDELDTIGKIVNLSNMSIDETNIILDNLYNKEISKLIKVDDYFLDNKIAYKVGDLK